MTEPLSCALIEGHSWPESGDPSEKIYGMRHYRFPPQSGRNAYDLDVVNAWAEVERPYNTYAIADELCLSRLPLYIPYRKRFALLKETPHYIAPLDPGALARRFPLVLTHLQRFCELGAPFQLLPYASNFLGHSSDTMPALVEAGDKRGLCSFIGNTAHTRQTTGYDLRRQVSALVKENPGVDCFGRDSNPIDDKGEGLRPYAFSIAMENARENYYFSEKLIDCILTGTIPIYWGCPDIGRFFDRRGILTFDSIEELRTILTTLSFDLYRRLRPYAEANYRWAIQQDLADFGGYLRRACEAARLGGIAFDGAPYRLRFGRRAKVTSLVRQSLRR